MKSPIEEVKRPRGRPRTVKRPEPSGFGRRMGERICKLRTKAGLTIRQAADLSEGVVGYTRWSEFEDGKVLRCDALLAVALVLGCCPSNLFPDEVRRLMHRKNRKAQLVFAAIAEL